MNSDVLNVKKMNEYTERSLRDIMINMIVEFSHGKGASVVINDAIYNCEKVIEQVEHNAVMAPQSKKRRTYEKRN